MTAGWRLATTMHPSAWVRLEAALLEADESAPAFAAVPNGGACSTVIVVAAEPDLRRYVRECLRERPALRVVEAAAVAAAVALAAVHQPACLVVDEPEARRAPRARAAPRRPPRRRRAARRAGIDDAPPAARPSPGRRSTRAGVAATRFERENRLAAALPQANG